MCALAEQQLRTTVWWKKWASQEQQFIDGQCKSCSQDRKELARIVIHQKSDKELKAKQRKRRTELTAKIAAHRY